MESAAWILDLYGMLISMRRFKVNITSSFYEVVSAFDDHHGFDAPDPQGHPDQWMYVGKTVTNRVLIIIYIAEGEEFHRLITAYEAKGKILNAYYKRS